MKSYFLFALAFVLMATACSPHIGKVITKTYPAIPSNEPVEIFMDPGEVPSDSESLGVVTIKDSGTTTHCDSLTVIELLKEEVRKVGGNAAVITEHIRPSFWGSSCHQMTGTILRVYDFDSYAVAESADSAQIVDVKVIKPQRQLSKITLAANIGYGWRTAKLNPDLPQAEKEFYKGTMSGLVTDVSFNYYFNDFYGLGVAYSRYNANQKMYGRMEYEDGGSENGYWKANSSIQFAGPVFLMRMPSTNQKWIFDCNIGVGYVGYSDRETFANNVVKVYGATVGGYFNLGAEYKINKSWAVGLRLSEVVGVLESLTRDTNGQKETIHVDNSNEGEGLGQVQLLMGLRYYLK
jgi:hypothetical protein